MKHRTSAEKISFGPKFWGLCWFYNNPAPLNVNDCDTVFATCSVSDPSFITSRLTTSHDQSFCGVSHSGLIPTHSTSMYILYTDYVDVGVWQSMLKARLTKGGPVANRDGNCQTEYNWVCHITTKKLRDNELHG
jgi:hypothetical protein